MKTKEETIQRKINQVIENKEFILETAYTQSLEQLVEELKIYHIELEFQNDELKRIQDELERTRDDFQSLFNQAPIGFVLLDEDLKVLTHNDCFKKLSFGWKDAFTNTDFRRFIHPDEQDRFHHFCNKLFEAGLPAQIELRLHRNVPQQDVYVNIFGSIRHKEKKELLLAIADISTQVATSKALKSNEEQLRTITDNLRDMVITSDLDGRINFVTPSCKAFGYEPADMIGKSVFDFVGADDLPGVLEAYRNVVENRQGTSIEFRSKNGDGTFIWVEVSMNFMPASETEAEKAVYVVRNVNERKLMQKEMEMSEQRFRSLFENNHAAMLVLDPHNLAILNANKAASNFYGYTQSQLCRMKINEINTLPVQDLHEKAMKAVNEEQIHFFFQHKLADGSIRDVEVFSGLVEQNEKEVLYSIIHDITDRKKAELLLVENTEALRIMNATKDKLFSLIAHDLRSPLGSILNLSELLLNEQENLKSDESLRIIRTLFHSAGNTYHLLENLLEWSRLQRGMIVPKYEKTDMSNFLDQLINTFKEVTTKKNLHIEVFVEDAAVAFIDVNLMQAVVRNILSNAIKFSYPGSAIQISVTKKTGQMLITIADHGVGMEKEMLDNVFRIDVNNGRPGTAGEKSIGLGLIICKDFLDLMDGQLKFESKTEVGTTATIVLPQET